MNNKQHSTKAGNIECIKGENRILIIAPHGFNGDGSRKLKADDKDTGKLARRIAKEFGFFAVINEKYKRAARLGDADKNQGLVDCARINQVRKFLKAEFLDPILEYKEEIAAKYGDPLVAFVHGIDDSKMEEYISDYKADKETSILIGAGQGPKSTASHTADRSTIDSLKKHLLGENESGMVAEEADKASDYCARHRNNLSQLFRHKNYADPRVQSIQLEIKKSFREPRKIDESVHAIGIAIIKIIEPSGETAPDVNLVDHAYITLAEIFSRHYESAMMEAGQYIVNKFYGGDIERARRKDPVRKDSLHQLIQKFNARQNGSPSKSWVYNAVNLVVDSHDLEGFHTYGKLLLSHKVLLLPLDDRRQKEELIEETVKQNFTVKQLREKIAELKQRDRTPLPVSKIQMKFIDKPDVLFTDEYMPFLTANFLAEHDSNKLDALLTRAQRKKSEIDAKIRIMTQHGQNYDRLIEIIGRVKKQKSKETDAKDTPKRKGIRNPEMSDLGKNWNVVTGCDKYSDGCLNCYAEDTVEWLQRMGQKVYQDNGFNLTLHKDKLDWPIKSLPKNPKRPARCFVTDMGDLFHAKVPDEFIYQVFEKMLKVPQHRFYVLTKRAERLGEFGPSLPWAPWIWAGVTVESNKYLDRIDHLKKLPPEVNKFLMLEPLLSPMPKLDLNGIHWVVVGGETNKRTKFRPMKEEWVIDIRDQVKDAGIPFMFKHWPGKTHNAREALLEGRIWREYPESVVKNMDWNARQ